MLNTFLFFLVARGDEVLALLPEMGLLGHSCKKVTNDCIALIHLNIHQILFINFVKYISTQHVCKEEKDGEVKIINMFKF